MRKAKGLNKLSPVDRVQIARQGVLMDARTKLGYGNTLIKTLVSDTNTKIDEALKVKDFETAYNLTQEHSKKMNVINFLAASGIQEKGMSTPKMLVRNEKGEMVEQLNIYLDTAHAVSIRIFADIVNDLSSNIEEYKGKVSPHADACSSFFESYELCKRMHEDNLNQIHEKLTIIRTAVKEALLASDNFLLDDEWVKVYMDFLNIEGDTTKLKEKAEDYSEEMVETVREELRAARESWYENRKDTNPIVIDTKMKVEDQFIILQQLILENLVDVKDIKSSIVGLASQYIFSDNDFDIASTVDTAVNICEEEVDRLELDKEAWDDIFGKVEDKDGIYGEPIHKMTDIAKLLILLERVQSLSTNMMSKEYLARRTHGIPKFMKMDETARARTYQNYSILGLTGTRNIHDRLICNYMDKNEETNELMLNPKSVVASIIFQLFIARLMGNPNFVRGMEMLFNGFLPITQTVWEEFAIKLDSVIAEVNIEDEAGATKLYQESLKMKVADYAHPEEEVDENAKDEETNESTEVK